MENNSCFKLLSMHTTVGKMLISKNVEFVVMVKFVIHKTLVLVCLSQNVKYLFYIVTKYHMTK